MGTANTGARISMCRDSNGSGNAYGGAFCLAMPGKANLFRLHFNSTPIRASMIRTGAARRKPVVPNAWEYPSVPKFKTVNRICLCI